MHHSGAERELPFVVADAAKLEPRVCRRCSRRHLGAAVWLHNPYTRRYIVGDHRPPTGGALVH